MNDVLGQEHNVKQCWDLAEKLGQALLERKWRVTTAESCTAGGVAYALTMIPGSSTWFEAGFITYSDHMKEVVLGVSPALLEEVGAVSEAVVQEMAEAALHKAGAELSVAVSGVAGPSGGSAQKPVGTVCFAFSMVGKRTKTHSLHFTGDRAAIRFASVLFALEGLLVELKMCDDHKT